METTEIIQALLSLIFVVALIGLVAFLFKRFVVEKNLLNKVADGKEKQLKIVDQLMLDHKRRVVVIKNKDKEYVILLSADSAEVIDNSITRTKKAN